jgi:hypothetical protein
LRWWTDAAAVGVVGEVGVVVSLAADLGEVLVLVPVPVLVLMVSGSRNLLSSGW